MRRVLEFLMVVAIASVAVFLLPLGEAEACTCLPAPGPAEAMERSDVVFSGEVLEIGAVGHVVQVRLKVEQSWKGLQAEAGDVVEVLTAWSSAACGYSFQKGSAYLIYGSREEAGIGVSLCSRTRQMEMAKEDVAVLDAVVAQQGVENGAGGAGSDVVREAMRVCAEGDEAEVSSWRCVFPVQDGGREGARYLDGRLLPAMCRARGVSVPGSWRCVTPRLR